MNKKLITTLILSLAVMLPTVANEHKTTEKLEKVAIQEQTDNTVEGAKSDVKSETLPNIDGMKEDLKNSSKNSTQIDSAKSIADKINASLKKEEYQSEVANEQVGQIVTVDDCVKIALASHPSIVSAKSSAEIYKTKIAQAWSAYFPRIGLGAEYSRNDMLIGSFAPPMQKYNMFYLPTVSANIKLYDFGKTKAEADIAKKTYEASEDNVQKSINEVIYNVKKSY